LGLTHFLVSTISATPPAVYNFPRLARSFFFP
jgi:hypothetical protein